MLFYGITNVFSVVVTEFPIDTCTRTASLDAMGKTPFSPTTEAFSITQGNCTAISLCSKSKTNQWLGSGAV